MTYFAVEVTPLAAEPLLNIGPFAFSNAMLYGLMAAILVLTVFGIAARASQVWPRSRLAFVAETLVEGVINLAADNFGSRAKAVKHLPFLMSLLTFILVSNLSGLLPGVGTITVTQEGGHAVPLLRAFTTDLNGTLALALLTIGSVQFYAIAELGLLGHLKHYFTMVSSNIFNPSNLFVGVIEIAGEFIRIMTLSMRLFGVIYAGEVLLHAIADLSGNLAWAATLPIVFLEIFFSLIQAYLFMMLTTVYLSIATHSEEHEPSEAEYKSGLQTQKAK